MWRSYRVPKTGQIIKKSSTYQMVMANSVALSSRVWMNPFSLKMLATRHTRDGFDILNPKTGQRTKADLDTLIKVTGHQFAQQVMGEGMVKIQRRNGVINLNDYTRFCIFEKWLFFK